MSKQLDTNERLRTVSKLLQGSAINVCDINEQGHERIEADHQNNFCLITTQKSFILTRGSSSFIRRSKKKNPGVGGGVLVLSLAFVPL